MNHQKDHIFTGGEAAMAYALCAERILAPDYTFLEGNPAIIPVFVSLLFQSLEIAIKHVGIESGLFTMAEARNHQRGKGHGVKELAKLAVERLGGDAFDPIVMAMTYFNININENSGEIIRSMICGKDFERTRESYALRSLGYAEVSDGDFAIIRPISDWVESVKQTASNLQSTIDVLSQWRASPSKSKHFAIWLRDH